MDNQEEFLTEERYKKTKRKITLIALLIFLIGIAIGGGMIGKGLSIKNSIDFPKVEAQKSAEFRENGFSEKYYELQSQLDKEFPAIALIMLGGFVTIVSCGFSISVFMSTKRRELSAYQVQQMRPIAEEGIEKMSPAVGAAAKEIAKGIKEGIKEE